MSNPDFDRHWRRLARPRVGGEHFDAPGAGYTFSAVLNEERELRKQNVAGDPSSALLTLSIADPTPRLDVNAMEALQLYYEQYPDCSRYSDLTGIADYYGKGSTNDLVAAYCNVKYGTVLTGDNVQWVPGSIKRALAEYIPAAFFDSSIVSHPSTLLIMPDPSYGVIADSINNRGVTIEKVPLLNNGGVWDLDLDGMARAIGSHEDDPHPFPENFMYVNIPHNPTGFAYTKEQWERLFVWAQKNYVTLIIDLAYIDLAYSDSVFNPMILDGWERHIFLGSVSKGFHATGLRFGWIVGHPTMIKIMRKVGDVKDSGMFAPTIAAALDSLQHPERAVVECERNRRLHEALVTALSRHGFDARMPDAGLCQFMQAPKSANGVEFVTAGDFTKWLRENFRISIMHNAFNGIPYVRFSVTVDPVPECDINTAEDVIAELDRRFSEITFSF